MLRGDKYNRWMWGEEATIPDVATVNPETVFVCTDTGNVYAEHDGAWVAISGSIAHDLNPSEGPHTGKLPWAYLDDIPSSFAPSAHTHPLSQISGIIAKGGLVCVNSPDVTVPTGADIHEEIIPALSIAGTAVKITKLQAHVASAPIGGSLVFTFKLDGVTIGSVTISSGATDGSTTLSPAVSISGGEKYVIDGPSDAHSARGMNLIALVERQKV